MNINSGDEDSVSLGESVAILHSDCTQSISYIKSSQWSATNYTVLIYGAMFSMKLTNKFDLNYKLWSFILFAIWLLFQVKSMFSLNEKRIRMKEIRDLLHIEARKIVEKVDYKHKIFLDYFTVIVPHLVIVLFSFWVVGWANGGK